MADTYLDVDTFTNWTDLHETNYQNHSLYVRRNGNQGFMIVDGYFRGLKPFINLFFYLLNFPEFPCTKNLTLIFSHSLLLVVFQIFCIHKNCFIFFTINIYFLYFVSSLFSILNLFFLNIFHKYPNKLIMFISFYMHHLIYFILL